MLNSGACAPPMDVYLVPVGPDGYELYCEPAHEAASPAEIRVTDWRARGVQVFRAVLTYLDQERDRRAARRAAAYQGTWWQRLRDRVVAWVAERVAEQRLLWRLYRADAALTHVPDDVTAEQADSIVRRSLKNDGTRHRNWLVIDGVGAIIAWPFTVLPGPNVPLYYFIFRVTGHFLSWRGARRGLATVRWSYEACPPLTELRRLSALPMTERAALAHDVGGRLGLEHIDSFAERLSRVSA
jgi:hypothetical protein